MSQTNPVYKLVMTFGPETGTIRDLTADQALQLLAVKYGLVAATVQLAQLWSGECRCFAVTGATVECWGPKAPLARENTRPKLKITA